MLLQLLLDSFFTAAATTVTAAQDAEISEQCLQHIIDDLSQQLQQSASSSSSSSGNGGSSSSNGGSSSSSPVCISSNGTEIHPPRVLSSQPGLKLKFSAARDNQAAAAAASEAAARAAAANADAGRAEAYTMVRIEGFVANALLFLVPEFNKASFGSAYGSFFVDTISYSNHINHVFISNS